MVMQASAQPTDTERKIISIVRNLPRERGLQLLAFARFLAFETFDTTDLDFLEDELTFSDAETEADARWDGLLMSEEGQLALDKLADDALADIRDGKARSVVFTDDGEIAPQ